MMARPLLEQEGGERWGAGEKLHFRVGYPEGNFDILKSVEISC